MRINAHCHVFNLQSVFTTGTKNILKYRLEQSLEGFSFLLTPLLELLEDAMKPDGGVPLKAPEKERARIICKALDKGGNEDEAELRADLFEVMRGIDDRSRSSLGSLCNRIERNLGISFFDPYLVSLGDLVEFISVAFASSMDDVTDYLFDCMAEGQGQGSVDRGDLVAAPLMMDILSQDQSAHTGEIPAEAAEELAVFERQRENTLRQCVRYPGRILPFYAVNPWRPDWLGKFKAAMEEGGFVGMKAYPSLGYEVKEIAAALEYCDEQGIPVVTHCNPGGFKAKDQYAAYCDPAAWTEVITSHDLNRLRLCFGHFGGENAFRPGHTHADWSCRIIELMQRRGPEVYADISYHTGGMHLSTQTRYFNWLESLLEPPNGPFASRVLFGTDYFLSLQQLAEDDYWRFFKRHLTDRQFERISRKNPAAFLGINQEMPEKSAPNIQRHLAWLRKQKKKMLPHWASGGNIANWLRKVEGFC